MLQRSSPRPAVPGSPQRRAVLPAPPPAPPPPQVGPGPARSPPAAGRARQDRAGHGGRARWLRGRRCRPVPPRAWGWPRRRYHKAGAAPPSPPHWKTGRAAAAGGSPTLRSPLSRPHLHHGSPRAGGLGSACSALPTGCGEGKLS